MVRYSIYTNPGSREINEDTGAAALNDKSYCFAIADGLGGHGGGEIASQAAINTICTKFVETGYSEHFFEQAFQEAQQAIWQEQEEKMAPSRMKTTLVILVIHGGQAIWAHIGDSRLYIFKRKHLKKRTMDHSVPQMLAISGEISEKEIRHHPDRNRLMRVMGVRGETPRYEQSSPIKLNGEHQFLLCTDGFWELIDENEMERTLRESSTPEEWLEKMQTIIAQNGQNTDMDNYSAIAIFAQGESLFRKWL